MFVFSRIVIIFHNETIGKHTAVTARIDANEPTAYDEYNNFYFFSLIQYQSSLAHLIKHPEQVRVP